MTASESSGGHGTPETAARGTSAHWLYRAAICVFPNAASALDGLRQISGHGAGMSDMAVIVPSREVADAVVSGGEDCPALFVRGQTPSEPEWRHMGLPASYTAIRLANVSAWASEVTVGALERDLSHGCVVVLVYGLRGMLQALMAEVLLHVAASRVELHDIPPGHLAS